MYNVNYDDERFKQVENEKQSELDKYNQTYDNGKIHKKILLIKICNIRKT